MHTLRDYQRRAILELYYWLEHHDGHPVLVLPTGCHSKGQGILMYDGKIKKVEDIVIGDKIMGPDSKPRTVLNLHRGSDHMFKIIPTKGQPFTVNGGHILSLTTTNEGKKYKCNTVTGTIENISVYDYIKKSKSWKHLRKLYRCGVDFQEPEKEKNLFGEEKMLPPRFVGMLLGDGHFGFNLGLTTMDNVLSEYFKSVVNDFGCVSYLNEKKITRPGL